MNSTVRWLKDWLQRNTAVSLDIAVRDAIAEIEKLESALAEATRQRDELYASWQSLNDRLLSSMQEVVELRSRNEQLEKAVPVWVSVGERLPEPGKPVLIACNGRALRAVWMPKHYATEADWGEFRGDTDEDYWPEGWYEWNGYDEVHWQTEHEPTHWQPLPQPPKEQGNG